MKNKVIGMEVGQYRYVAPVACPPNTDRSEYYKHRKGEYIENVLGKDGKFILPARFYPNNEN